MYLVSGRVGSQNQIIFNHNFASLRASWISFRNPLDLVGSDQSHFRKKIYRESRGRKISMTITSFKNHFLSEWPALTPNETTTFAVVSSFPLVSLKQHSAEVRIFTDNVSIHTLHVEKMKRNGAFDGFISFYWRIMLRVVGYDSFLLFPSVLSPKQSINTVFLQFQKNWWLTSAQVD